MSTHPAFHAYLLGLPLVGLGLYAFFDPVGDHKLFGVPAPGAPTPTSTKTPVQNNISPFVYAKAVRDLAIGGSVLALQHQGNDEAVTTLIAAGALVGLGDGCVVWACGRKEKAWGHWLGTMGMLVPLVAWRVWR